MSTNNITFVNNPVFTPASSAFFAAVGAALRSLATRAYTALKQSVKRPGRNYEEAYLAESVDRYDLEFRMRELARANPQPYWMTGLGR
ncbi:DUF3563 family protein [Janthinobacterium fluminis]|uniref:DUF3563 family protein n=1 Tax=Janthinobacterium fluminis TaxID=2987524 RepID=A0ABT5K7C5_9BURK|nr:DUF3563 family protein [Janthinobacterium fluminis]MDC8760804.1 DUF3563 family protein [Janthinobacterium fluminis]